MVRSISDIRRDEITDAVLQILATRGPAAINVQEIADTVGMAKSSLYHHFTSADELIEAALEKGDRIVTDFFNSAIQQAASPFQALLNFMSDMTTHSTVAVAFERVANETSVTASRWSQHVVKFRDKVDAKLTGLVQAAQQNHEIREDIGAAEIVTTLLSLLVYQYVIYRVRGDTHGVAAGANSAIKIFKKLVAKPA
jgi:AcrR family transcriptional regulator